MGRLTKWNENKELLVREEAESHFRNAEQKMLEYFKGTEKGYRSEVNGWTLDIQSFVDQDEGVKINLMETCNWSVEYDDDVKMAF